MSFEEYIFYSSLTTLLFFFMLGMLSYLVRLRKKESKAVIKKEEAKEVKEVKSNETTVKVVPMTPIRYGRKK